MLKEVQEETCAKAVLGKNRVIAIVGKWIEWKLIILSKVRQTQEN